MEEANQTTRNKGGRPKKALKKNQRITVKCTYLDKTTIAGKAKLSERSVSEYLLELALVGQVDTRPKELPGPLLELRARLLSIGNNLNQLTRILNGKPSLFAVSEREQLQKVLTQLEDVLTLFKQYQR